MAGLFTAGAVSCALGGFLKFQAGKSNEQASHLRGTKRLSVAEVTQALTSLPPGARIYAATEGLLTGKRLVLASNGEHVLYCRTSTVEVRQEWRWESDKSRRGGGHWKSKETESSSVERNERNGGIGLFSGSAVAFADGSVENETFQRLLVKHSEHFEPSKTSNVTVNNANSEHPPPPQTLGFKKTEHVVRKDGLAFAVGEFYLASDPTLAHKSLDGLAPGHGAGSSASVAFGRPVSTNESVMTSGDRAPFRIGHGTLAEEIDRLSTTSRQLHTFGNAALAVGAGFFVGAYLVKSANDSKDD